jgi:hypothetical protein
MKIEITRCIISDHNRIKLELNSKRNHRKYSNTWRLNTILLTDQWVSEERSEEIKKFLESNEMKIQPTRICGIQLRPC